MLQRSQLPSKVSSLHSRSVCDFPGIRNTVKRELSKNNKGLCFELMTLLQAANRVATCANHVL